MQRMSNNNNNNNNNSFCRIISNIAKRLNCCSNAGSKYTRNKVNYRDNGEFGTLRGELVRTYNYSVDDDYYLDSDQELGKGGCGVVIVGESKISHTQYAIKIVNKTTGI